MKKILLVIIVLGAVALVRPLPAYANGGPHGGYTATTDGCAGCHRAHTASGAKLLVATDTYTLCMTCHGTSGTGADTNVQDGYFLATRGPSTMGVTNTITNGALLGGGFAFYKGITTTSTHAPNGTISTAWGNGVSRGISATLTSGALTCASCHDPHGSANYRIIRASVNGITVSVSQVDEGVIKDYDTEQWGAGQSNLCSACHSSYHKIAAGQGSILDAGTYTHRIGMSGIYTGTVNPETTGFGGLKLPLAQTGTANAVVCQTCHMPHGTSSAMSGFANGGPTGTGGQPGNTTAANSALLRLDNRAVCEVCHQK